MIRHFGKIVRSKIVTKLSELFVNCSVFRIAKITESLTMSVRLSCDFIQAVTFKMTLGKI